MLPPVELNGRFSENRASGLQPVKLMVKAALCEPPEAMSPSIIGNADGGVITGEQAAPAVCVKVNPFSWVAYAMPGPGLVMVMVHTRAF
ncbi:MAG: hypothetical protein JO061_09800 [Acidobacteriaceae bacterium]|nr:hypothetical protein [Acidobacteriaceae bacterium]